MISCFLIGKDTSVCVRCFTSDAITLKPWIDLFERGPCHVHCHAHVSSIDEELSYENELRTWLTSSSCASAVMLLDPRSSETNAPAFLELCAKAKRQGVFIAVFVGPQMKWNVKIEALLPNWKLEIGASPQFMQSKVNEILGVIRFSRFSTN